MVHGNCRKNQLTLALLYESCRAGKATTRSRTGVGGICRCNFAACLRGIVTLYPPGDIKECHMRLSALGNGD